MHGQLTSNQEPLKQEVSVTMKQDMSLNATDRIDELAGILQSQKPLTVVDSLGEAAIDHRPTHVVMHCEKKRFILRF